MTLAASAISAIDPRTLTATSDLAKRLRAHVEFLASPALKGRKPGSPGNEAAARYLTKQFQELGLRPFPSLEGYGQSLPAGLGENILGYRPARDGSTERWLLIGAHYDHLGESMGRVYAGADDNASAVAILLETARDLPALSRYPVVFAAFNAEEPPYIRTAMMGSQYFVSHLPAEIATPARFQAVVIMDLMGGVHWEPLREVIFAAGAEKSEGLSAALQDVRREALGVRGEEKGLRLTPDALRLTVVPVGMHLIEEIPMAGRVSFSDYDAFRNASVPFLFLSAGRTPRYHDPSDLADTLHYERMAATVRWLQRLAARLDRDPAPYRFEAEREDLRNDIARLQPFIMQAADWRSRIPGSSVLSVMRFKADVRWLERLDPAAVTPDDVRRLERSCLRMQCLLADFYGCFAL